MTYGGGYRCEHWSYPGIMKFYSFALDQTGQPWIVYTTDRHGMWALSLNAKDMAILRTVSENNMVQNDLSEPNAFRVLTYCGSG